MALLSRVRELAVRGADLRLADRLRDRLHRLPQARDAAKYCHWRRRRRRAAGLGWVAVTQHHWQYALLLFLIIFVWTPPHFWALAIFRRDDYAKAMIPMLPVTHGVEYTRWQVLFYTVLLVLVTLLPFIVRMSGLVYLAGALALGIGFLWHAVRC
jgi:hypothetical protein